MEIPGGAIEAAAGELEIVGGFTHLPPAVLRNGGRQILKAALPALREQWKSELLTDEAIHALYEYTPDLGDDDARPTLREATALREGIEAALDAPRVSDAQD